MGLSAYQGLKIMADANLSEAKSLRSLAASKAAAASRPENEKRASSLLAEAQLLNRQADHKVQAANRLMREYQNSVALAEKNRAEKKAKELKKQKLEQERKKIK